MKIKVLTVLALLAALYPVRGSAQTLNDPAPALPEHFIELSFNYSTLRTNAPVGECGCFWTNGGSVELAVPLWRYVSSVAEFSGGHSGSIPGNSGVGLNLISALGGVRVARPLNRRFIPYAQGLVGVVHAFDSYFPSSLGSTPSATSFALAAGGGLEVVLSRRWLIRVAQVDYQYMQLPNNMGNQQHDIRLSAGIVLRLNHYSLIK
jgi:outer membrane immunogenic protein